MTWVAAAVEASHHAVPAELGGAFGHGWQPHAGQPAGGACQRRRRAPRRSDLARPQAAAGRSGRARAARRSSSPRWRIRYAATLDGPPVSGGSGSGACTATHSAFVPGGIAGRRTPSTPGAGPAPPSAGGRSVLGRCGVPSPTQPSVSSFRSASSASAECESVRSMLRAASTPSATPASAGPRPSCRFAAQPPALLLPAHDQAFTGPAGGHGPAGRRGRATATWRPRSASSRRSGRR